MSKFSTMITIEDEPIEAIAYREASEKFKDKYREDKHNQENGYAEIYGYEISLIKTTHIFTDFGDYFLIKYEFFAKET